MENLLTTTANKRRVAARSSTMILSSYWVARCTWGSGRERKRGGSRKELYVVAE